MTLCCANMQSLSFDIFKCTVVLVERLILEDALYHGVETMSYFVGLLPSSPFDSNHIWALDVKPRSANIKKSFYGLARNINTFANRLRSCIHLTSKTSTWRSITLYSHCLYRSYVTS